MKKIILALACIFFVNFYAGSAEKKIKLYAFYTPTHKEFVDEWFLPSIQDNFEVILECHKQECANGAFMHNGWIQCMLKKVDLIIRGIKENMGSYFIHSDVDIQFFQPCNDAIEKLMENNDMVIQLNDPRGEVCAGFFACKGNKKTLKLWEAVRKYMIDHNTHDQLALNELIRKTNPYNIKWELLPVEFFCGGTLTGRGWRPGAKLTVPKNIILHHANWTIGVQNKIAQLQYIKKHVSRLREKNAKTA